MCFRTSTSACPFLLTSEFLTVTWRSCSSAAHPSTSRSADARAEPRWSVTVCVCVCLCLCVLPLLLLRHSCPTPSVQVTIATGPMWDKDRLIWSHKRTPSAYSSLNWVIIHSFCVWCCRFDAECQQIEGLCILEVYHHLSLKSYCLCIKDKIFSKGSHIAFLAHLVPWCNFFSFFWLILSEFIQQLQ